MATFNFGTQAQAAPAPAAGGFNFGAAPAAPAPAGGGLTFGATTPAPTPAAATPAPSGSTFSFGGTTPTPAAATPAPSGSNFSFGGTTPTFGGTTPTFGGTTPTPAAAATQSTFSFTGTTPTPAPSTGGFNFSSTSTPTPATSSLATTAAPGNAFSFGNTPAPAPTNTGSIFGGLTPATATLQQQPQSQPPIQISGYTPYSSLPIQVQQHIDSIYNLIHQHQQTVTAVQSMTPSLLSVSSSEGNTDTRSTSTSLSVDVTSGPSNETDTAATTAKTPLGMQLNKLDTKCNQLQSALAETIDSSQTLLQRSGSLYQFSYQYLAWPLQSCAARKQIALPKTQSLQQQLTKQGPTPATTLEPLASTTTSTTIRLNEELVSRAATVDHMEQLPSPYYWTVLRELEERIGFVIGRMETMKKELNRVLMANGNENGNYVEEGDSGENQVEDLKMALQNHTQALFRISSFVGTVHNKVDQLKKEYTQQFVRVTRPKIVHGIGGGSSISTVSDPFADADRKEMEEKKRLEEEVRRKFLVSAPVPAVVAPTATPTTPATAAPTGGSLFGNPAPAATTTPTGGLFGAPATPTGGLFGAPATPTGGLFGAPATPAATTNTTGGNTLFGAATPAPAGGLFGSTAATPAATPGGGLFGSTTTAPATAAPAVAGGVFGSTPGVFGSTTPATPTSVFGATPAATPATGGSLFGGAPATPAPATGLFGGTPATSGTTRPSSGGSGRSRRKPGRRR